MLFCESLIVLSWVWFSWFISDCIKAYGPERRTVFVGRCDKPVRKLRTMPMARAHELAKKLQGRFGTTMSVV